MPVEINPNIHPKELWMWGADTALGTSLYWNIEHKVLRLGKWISDIPYSCSDKEYALQEAAKMSEQKSFKGEFLYKDVLVTGPHISWREIWWKYARE